MKDMGCNAQCQKECDFYNYFIYIANHLGPRQKGSG